mmetsp:Transcript_109564/g.283220  ORF Transcript_109564/g.283220 Transcript_109564/m.283220 type:complete len:231 (-) Transcript_109564:328-1020(-)
MSQKLGDDRDRLGAINLVVRAVSVEARVAHSIRVEVATILVTHTQIALTLGVISAFGALALGQARLVARVWCVRGGPAVCLPDVHLSAARAEVPHRRHVRAVPIHGVCLALDELDVVRALRIAVASAILGSCSVATAIPIATLVHLHEVHSAIQATREVAHISGEGELPIFQPEHLVGILAVHDVQARAVVRGVRALGHKLQVNAVLVAVGLDPVGAGVVRTIHPTTLSA